MKRLLTLTMLLCLTIIASAQSQADIDSLFDKKYRKNPDATETVISGDALKGTGLQLYRSLVITGHPELADKIAEGVSRCGSKAVNREIKYVNGKIYYANYTLRPQGRDNRYIFYLNSNLKGGDRIMLVYMSGTASPEEVKRIITKK